MSRFYEERIDRWKERRTKDPQGLIDDLVQLTSRQAKRIGELKEENKSLSFQVEAAKNFDNLSNSAC